MEALLDSPDDPRWGYVLAHGAGAGMRHPFLAKMAAALKDRGVATLRYEFPYMEQKKNRPDKPEVAAARVREAVAEAAKLLPGVPLIAGGKSFGGRMTSTAQSMEPLPGVRGLAFLGFPLHAPGKPGIERAAHLAQVQIPMLFLQGTRDEFANLDLLRPITNHQPRTTLHLIEGGDHSFNVRGARSSGRDVMEELASALDGWVSGVALGGPSRAQRGSRRS